MLTWSGTQFSGPVVQLDNARQHANSGVSREYSHLVPSSLRFASIPDSNAAVWILRGVLVPRTA